MKILITSDIHFHLENVKILKERYNDYYHLDAGDSTFSDKLLNDLKISSVRGNCDYSHNLPLFKIMELDNKRILITHGHLQAVKNGLSLLIKEAVKRNVDVVIYGHTHLAMMGKVDKLTILNPGSLRDGKYALYENGKFILKEL